MPFSSWRIYPHLQNTGGFFVAVLERSPSYTVPVPSKKPSKRSAAEVQGTPDPEGRSHLASERLAKRPRLDHPGGGASLDIEMIDAEDVEDEAAEEPPKLAVEENKQPKGWVYKEDPYTYVDPAHPNVRRCL